MELMHRGRIEAAFFGSMLLPCRKQDLLELKAEMALSVIADSRVYMYAAMLLSEVRQIG